MTYIQHQIKIVINYRTMSPQVNNLPHYFMNNIVNDSGLIILMITVRFNWTKDKSVLIFQKEPRYCDMESTISQQFYVNRSREST